MEKDIIKIIDHMEAPRLSEWLDLIKLFKKDSRSFYLMMNAYNYGKMKGKQEARLPEYRILKKLTKKYGKNKMEPRMNVKELLEFCEVKNEIYIK